MRLHGELDDDLGRGLFSINNMNIQITSKPASSYANNWSSTDKTLLVDLVAVELMLEEIKSTLECYGGPDKVRAAIGGYFRSNAPHPVIHLESDHLCWALSDMRGVCGICGGIANE